MRLASPAHFCPLQCMGVDKVKAAIDISCGITFLSNIGELFNLVQLVPVSRTKCGSERRFSNGVRKKTREEWVEPNYNLFAQVYQRYYRTVYFWLRLREQTNISQASAQKQWTVSFSHAGTFAGTTSLSIALVLPEDGQMVTIDFKEDWVSTGRPIWEKVRSSALFYFVLLFSYYIKVLAILSTVSKVFFLI